MKILNPFMLFIAIIQIGGAVYFWIWLKSPIIALIQLTYAISNILFSLIKGV